MLTFYKKYLTMMNIQQIDSSFVVEIITHSSLPVK